MSDEPIIKVAITRDEGKGCKPLNLPMREEIKSLKSRVAELEKERDDQLEANEDLNNYILEMSEFDGN